MATFAGLPDPTQVSSADAAARLAAAQAANLAWRTNTAPVLPRMGAPAPGSPGTEQDLTRIYVGGTADVQGTPMDLTRSQYIAQFGRTPEEAESAKHMEHFHPAEFFGTTMDAMQGMTLGQIASRYGSRAADYVQDYSRERPSARFQAITQAYEAQQQRSIDASGAYYQPTAAGSGKNPYPEDSAAGIAWEVAKTGGASDTRLNAIAAVEVTDIFGGDPGFITFATNQYIERPKFADEYLTTKEGGTIQNKAWEGVPIRQNITLAELNQLKTIPTGFELESGIHTAPGDWGGMYVPETSKSQETSDVPGRIRGDKTVAALGDYIDVLGADALSTFVPYGRYSQEQLDNTKLGIARKTGELAIYQYNERFGTWDLIGGGGRNALQSGMFSVGKALTPYVATQGEIGTYERAPGKGKYRLGSEGSGGFVKEYGESGPRLLAPNEAISRYYGDGKYNLANLVDQVAAGKSEEPGADIPWAVLPTAPAIQYMDKSGMTGEKADVLEGVIYSVPMIGDLQKKANVGIGASDRLVGGGMVGGAGTVLDIGYPVPFKSESKPAQQATQQGTGLSEYDRSVLGGYSGGLIGYALWGEKSPEVIKGFAGSVGDFAIGVATLGQWQPFKEKMQQTDVGQQEYLKQKAAMESSLALPESYQKDVSAYEKAKSEYDIKLAGYSAKATAYQSGTKTEAEYNKLMEEKAKLDTEGSKLKIMYSGLQSQNIGIEQRNKAYDEFIKQGISSGYLKYTGKGEIETTTTKTYDYGEYSKAGASLGTTFRSMMGFSEEQLEAYGTVVENKPIEIGPWYDPLASVREKIVYGTGKVVSTHPEKIATAYGGGGVLVVGGGVVGGALEAAGAGTGATATAARGVLAGGKYVLPVVFTGAMGYSVTEGGKASAGKTLVNVGEMFPEAAGAALGGGSTYLISGSNLPIGFGTKKTEYAKGYEPIEIDLTGKYPQTRVGAPKGTTEYPSTLPSDLRVAEPEPFIQIGGTRLGKGALEQAKTIERVPAGAEIPFETVPATSDIVMSEAMLNIKSEKVFIRKTGGDVVGAVGYAEGPEGIFIKAIGSTEKGTGVGSALIGEVKGIARERGIRKISGEATTESMGFWEKQGAVIRTEPGKSLHPFEIDVGKSTPLSGTEMGSVSESTQLGFLDLGKSKTSAQYSMDQMVADFNRYSQQPSAPTSLLWEKQASLWKSPQPTGILPMDLLPGTGRVGGLPLTEMSWGKPAARPLSGEIPVGEVSLEFLGKGIGKSTERGLTISGAGMSQQMLESVVTKGGIKAPTSYLSNIDVLIQKGTTISRVKPAVEAAKQQKIVPSATEATFERTSTISARNFEDALLGIVESEKRAPVKTTTKKIPKGMQMDYLRDALRKKTSTIEVSGGKKQQAVVGKAILGPTRETLTGYINKTGVIVRGGGTIRTKYGELYDIGILYGGDVIRKDIGGRQTPMQPAASRRTPIPVQKPVTTPVQKPVTTPVQKPVNIFKPKQKPQQKQTPYVAPKTGSKQSQQQVQTPSQRQTPYVAPALPTPVTPTTAKPEKPEKQTPYVPPVLVTPPTTPKTPGTTPSTTPDQPKPIIPPPVIPFGFNFNLPSGGGGGGGYKKGSRGYVETLGLVSKQFDPFSKSKAKPRKKSKWSF